MSDYIASNRSAPHTLIPILVSRSSAALVSQDYSPIQLSSALESLAASTLKPLSFPDEALTYLKQAPGEVILVDNTSDEKLASYYPVVLKNGIHIATPNKKAFSGDITLWNSIFSSTRGPTNPQGGYVFHEAAVGAGLPVLSTLKELVETGDKVKKIEGIFSGTMSFLFNTFAPVGSSSNARFSEVVIKARGLGYTVSRNVWEQKSPLYTYNSMGRSRILEMISTASTLHENLRFSPGYLGFLFLLQRLFPSNPLSPNHSSQLHPQKIS